MLRFIENGRPACWRSGFSISTSPAGYGVHPRAYGKEEKRGAGGLTVGPWFFIYGGAGGAEAGGIEFARRHAPAMAGYERDSLFPVEVYRKMGERGWTGSIIPRYFDGMGKGAIKYSIISEELSYFGVITP